MDKEFEVSEGFQAYLVFAFLWMLFGAVTKLFGVLTLSWWWVTLPFIIPAIITVAIMFVYVMIYVAMGGGR